jgi:5-methylcytosine-specific restriction endonuclease McrA
LRLLVEPQINDFKEQSDGLCECGSFASDVDHIVPFKMIVNAFNEIEDNGEGSCPEGRQNHNEPVPTSLWESNWVEYHKNHAQLQSLCRQCHYSKTYQK